MGRKISFFLFLEVDDASDGCDIQIVVGHT